MKKKNNENVVKHKISKLNIIGISLIRSIWWLLFAWGPGLLFGGAAGLLIIGIAELINLDAKTVAWQLNISLVNIEFFMKFFIWYVFIIASSLVPIENYERALKVVKSDSIIKLICHYIFIGGGLHIIVLFVSIILYLFISSIFYLPYMEQYLYLYLGILFYIQMFVISFYYNNKSVEENNELLDNDLF